MLEYRSIGPEKEDMVVAWILVPFDREDVAWGDWLSGEWITEVETDTGQMVLLLADLDDIYTVGMLLRGETP